MIKTITKILALVVFATAALSCSKAFLGTDDPGSAGERTIVVSGVVSDVATNNLLTGIKITFAAYSADNSISILPLTTKTVYTDGKGVYTVEVKGLSGNLNCTLTAESTEQSEVRYESMTNKVLVSWTGTSFDPKKGLFVVNDCNFQMKATE